MSESKSDRPIAIGANTWLKFTPGQLATVIAVVGAAVMAYAKVPTTDDVSKIAATASTQAVEAALARVAERPVRNEERISALEESRKDTAEQLRQLNERMGRVLELLSISVAQDVDRSPRARATAKRVRAQIERGENPLDAIEQPP